MAEKGEGEGGGNIWGTIGAILAVVAGVPAALVAAYQIYLVATGQQSIVDYLQGNQATQTVVVAPRGGGVIVANCSDPKEKEAWDRATTEKTRVAYGAYLMTYPNCPNADKARDIVNTQCRTVTEEVWKSSPMFQSNQAVRGVGSIPTNGSTNAQACAAAKKMANEQAQTNCEALANGGGYRNPVWKVMDRDCSCDKVNDLVTTCIADLAASCTWEAKIPEQKEVCG